MIFLLNFVHFEAIFAYSETIFAYSETDFANFETKIPDRCGRGSSLYSPMQDVAPSAVSIASGSVILIFPHKTGRNEPEFPHKIGKKFGNSSRKVYLCSDKSTRKV